VSGSARLLSIFAVAVGVVLSWPGRAAGDGFKSLAPPMGVPLARTAPGVWTWVPVDGAVCRDGSPTGFFVRFSSASRSLMIYLEGGGTCFNQTTCDWTPHNVGETVTGETVVASRAARRPQVPWTTGILDTASKANPVRDWNMVYVPYCTGDAHSGTRADAVVPGVAGKQQFVGYRNMTKFLSRIVPTFRSADKVLLTGASAGGIGAGMNFNQTQDGFGRVPVVLLDDSGPVFDDAFFAPCLQRQMRQLWGIDAALPPDCPDCFRPDGSGLGAAAVFLRRKYPGLVAGMVSSVEDEVIRFFLAWGENDCHVAGYTRDKFRRALDDMRDGHGFSPAQLGTFFYPGRRHMHLFRDRFYTEAVGGVTLAQWTADLIAGKPSRVAPVD
jgi:hypothetical protein